jgi:hypothetical protein
MIDQKAITGARGSAPSVNVSQVRTNFRVFAALAFAWALAVAGLFTVGSARMYGQLDTATLNGTVTDPKGGAIPGATVTVTNKDTSVDHTVTSNGDGNYTVPSLQPGTYIVTVSKAGFSNSKETGVTLQVGSNSQTVEVTASTAFLDTTDASLGTVITEQQVTDLPLNGRQFSELLQLAPGTVPIDNSQNAGKAPKFRRGCGKSGRRRSDQSQQHLLS